MFWESVRPSFEAVFHFFLEGCEKKFYLYVVQRIMRGKIVAMVRETPIHFETVLLVVSQKVKERRKSGEGAGKRGVGIEKMYCEGQVERADREEMGGVG